MSCFGSSFTAGANGAGADRDHVRRYHTSYARQAAATTQIGVALQGLILWVPIEKLFMTQIGFDAASVGVMAAAYAAVTPLLEVPSGFSGPDSCSPAPW